MRVRLGTAGEIFEGEPVEIIEAMQYRAWGWEDRPLAEYMAWLVEQAREPAGRQVVEPLDVASCTMAAWNVASPISTSTPDAN